MQISDQWKPIIIFTSRVSGRGHRIGAVFLYVCVCLCVSKRARKCATREVRERSGVFILNGKAPEISPIYFFFSLPTGFQV